MTPETHPRPRVEGEREQEILHATLDVLAEVGYDRLTMDAVAAAAKASKATLYRRWSSKSALVIDAVLAQKGPTTAPDTGSLREDLLQMHCGAGGVTDERAMSVLASVITAVNIDPEFATAFRRDFIGPKVAAGRAVFERARERGEIGDDVDLDLIAPALAGMVLHRTHLLGEPPSKATIAALIDQVVLPACHATHTSAQPQDKDHA
ncbi:TetR/AcrR family transcriptional regulator [Knoellia locipacati]|uniref:TetR family transcriptional regulator n=1 Tax=Knoellia locipacati TaxID=882824 RepID=A0A512SYQ7_9MICO|nr:TetR/AcrR family transcriptional regulator [Knoellia locipacati]GEQ13035.1 TetR family transcriptional regulator [Knoellia locipacati]